MNTFVVCLLLINNLPLNDINSIHTSLLNEAMDKWSLYENESVNIQGIMKVHLEHNDTVILDNILEIRANHHCSLLSAISNLGRKEGSLFCYNVRYAFHLKKSHANPSWSLANYFQRINNELPTYITNEIPSARIGLIAAVAPYWITLTDLVKKKYFKIISIKDVNVENSIVELVFESKHEIKEDPVFNPIQGGRIIMDKQKYFYVKQCRLDLLHGDGAGQADIIIEAKNSKDGYPIPISYTNTMTLSTTNGELRRVVHNSYDVDIVDELPGDHEFTLSAFGLEEPFGITWERPTPWWIYFGLIGGGCLVGFVLIGVFLRRRYGAS